MNQQAILHEIEKQYMKPEIPELRAGDIVKVHVRVREAGKERTQIFEGVVIARKHGGVRDTITVRKISYGVGVERTFPIHAPVVSRLEVVRRGKVRRAKLYYLRARFGKAARLKEDMSRPRGTMVQTAAAVVEEVAAVAAEVVAPVAVEEIAAPNMEMEAPVETVEEAAAVETVEETVPVEAVEETASVEPVAETAPIEAVEEVAEEIIPVEPVEETAPVVAEETSESSDTSEQPDAPAAEEEEKS